ncbi:MAG: lysylphosphatidylglycerol synthase domain-containing protein [Gemmatimonadota bacterium]
MRLSAALATVLGLLILTGLLFWQGVGEVGRALATAGWGLLLLVPIHLVILAVDAVGLWVLFPRPRPAFSTNVRVRWLGESVNQLLPVAQVGGEIAKVGLLRRAGVPGRIGAGAVVVALTAAAATQAVFGLLGVGLLLFSLGRHHLLPALLLGLGGFAILVGLFYRLQRRGLFGGLARRLAWLLGEKGGSELATSAAGVDEAIQEIYRRRGALASSLAWHLLGWVLGTAEVWVAMRLLGMPVSLGEALILESVGQAVRGAAFLIPGALGVQEGAYLALGAFMGLGPGVSLALSLAKRARELLLGLPGLATWQVSEGKGLWRWFRRLDAKRAG